MIWLKSVCVGLVCAVAFCLLIGFILFLTRPMPQFGHVSWNPLMFLKTVRAWVLLAVGFLGGFIWEHHRATQLALRNLR